MLVEGQAREHIMNVVDKHVGGMEEACPVSAFHAMNITSSSAGTTKSWLDRNVSYTP